MIEAKHLQKFYNKGSANQLHVINDISLELPEKGMVAIFGRSGCGKTTLLNVLGGLDKADGELKVCGEQLKKNADVVRNRSIGYIFQNYNLNKAESVYENVANALRLVGMRDEEEIARRVTAALANVGMERYVRRLPETLSGGQQQRVAIARAIVKNPAIILADESTGNLDEMNTVQVMELLRQIAEDHLVLLVTHEAKLVEYYCDRVIELNDGRVLADRTNSEVRDYLSSNTKDIYLKDLPVSRVEGEMLDMLCYGDSPEEPLRIRIVRRNGQTYLKVETAGVQVLDDSSEIRLRDEHYVPQEHLEEQRSRIDMSALSPIVSSSCGKLFTFSGSVRSGFQANFRKRKNEKKEKKTRKLMRRCLFLFAALLVLTVAYFGTAIRDYRNLTNEYNTNVFSVICNSTSAFERLEAALQDPESGFNAGYLGMQYHISGREISFVLGSFETFQMALWNSNYYADCMIMPLSAAAEMPLAAGKKEGLLDTEILLTTRMADNLLSKSSFEYVREYDDLLRMISGYSVSDSNCQVAGIVESDEMTVFATDYALAMNTLSFMNLNVVSGESVGFDVPRGEVKLVWGLYESTSVSWESEGSADETASVMSEETKQVVRSENIGKTVTIMGKEYTIADVIFPNPKDSRYAPFYDIDTYFGEKFIFPKWYTNRLYLMEREDFINTSKCFGRCDKDVTENTIFALDEEGNPTSGNYWEIPYMMLHSVDPEKSEAYVAEHFSDLTSQNEYYAAVNTPSMAYEEALNEKASAIRGGVIAMAVMVSLMALCLFFMMRSALMSRVKEVGIYRAIGVSRKNLIFRFNIETLTLTALTSLPGYLAATVLMIYWLDSSALMGQFFYYPWWIALIVLAVLLVLSLFCGTLPVRILLRKTPSEILSKYDI